MIGANFLAAHLWAVCKLRLRVVSLNLLLFGRFSARELKISLLAETFPGYAMHCMHTVYHCIKYLFLFPFCLWGIRMYQTHFDCKVEAKWADFYIVRTISDSCQKKRGKNTIEYSWNTILMESIWKQPWHQFLNYISHSQRLRHQSKAPTWMR